MGKQKREYLEQAVTETELEPLKYDRYKPPTALLPAEALIEVAHVLGFGAKKYRPHGWRRGIHYSRLYAAALRHLFAWWEGEKLDPESGFHHLAHAITNLLFLLTYERRVLRYASYDDRPATAEKEEIHERKETESGLSRSGS